MQVNTGQRRSTQQVSPASLLWVVLCKHSDKSDSSTPGLSAYWDVGSKALDQTCQWGVQHPTRCLLGAHDAKGFGADPRGTLTDLAFAGAGPSVRPWHCGWTGQGEAGPTREVSEDVLLGRSLHCTVKMWERLGSRL